MVEGPIEGPIAWRRTDLRPEDWRVDLGEAATGELLAAADRVAALGIPLTDLRPDSFDLPECRRTMQRVVAILRDGVGFALVSRLPVERLSEDQAKALYWVLSSMVARPVAQKLDGTMVYDVHDTGRAAAPGSGVRPDKTNIDLAFHNDNSYNAVLPEVVCLLCLRPAREGGRSRVMSFATAHNAIRERFPAVLPRLYRDFWFDRQREHRPEEPTLFAAPIFAVEDGGLRARLGLHQVRNGTAMRGGDLDQEAADSLTGIEAVFADPALQFEFDMQAGEMQFAANRKLGHSRTLFTDHVEQDKKRLLIRLWLRDHGGVGYEG